MKVVQVQVEIGEDRMLHVRLPEDTPIGLLDVVVALAPAERRTMSAEERRAAIDAGAGALREVGGSVEEFLAERRADEERRDKALGL